MAVRKVSGRGRNMIGHFPSLKMRRMVAFESLIEQDFLYILDYEQDVIAFAEQPVRIEYEWQGNVKGPKLVPVESGKIKVDLT